MVNPPQYFVEEMIDDANKASFTSTIYFQLAANPKRTAAAKRRFLLLNLGSKCQMVNRAHIIMSLIHTLLKKKKKKKVALKAVRMKSGPARFISTWAQETVGQINSPKVTTFWHAAQSFRLLHNSQSSPPFTTPLLRVISAQALPMAMYIVSRRVVGGSTQLTAFRYATTCWRPYSTSFREERDTFGPILVPSDKSVGPSLLSPSSYSF